MISASQQFLCDTLQCGQRDIDYLDHLIDRYDLRFSIQDVLNSHKSRVVVNINHVIRAAYELVAESFWQQNKVAIRKVTGCYNILDVEYDIHTNFADSRIWFTDSAVHALFTQWDPRACTTIQKRVAVLCR